MSVYVATQTFLLFCVMLVVDLRPKAEWNH